MRLALSLQAPGEHPPGGGEGSLRKTRMTEHNYGDFKPGDRVRYKLKPTRLGTIVRKMRQHAHDDWYVHWDSGWARRDDSHWYGSAKTENLEHVEEQKTA